MRFWFVSLLLLATAAAAQEVDRDAPFLACDDPFSLAADYLDQRDEALRALALEYVLNHDGWVRHPTLRRRLVQLLSDGSAADGERATVVWLFGQAGAFSDVREAALRLAGDHTKPNLAHLVAEAVVGHQEYDPGTLRELCSSEIRAVREEAIRLAYDCDGESMPAATEMLLANAEDFSEPEWVRGTAIRTLGECPDNPASQHALLELLDRRFWFFGAAGAHFRVHSLALVIGALRWAHDPAIHSRLLTLRSEITVLRMGEREYVEWVLANALGEHREIFHGPVEP